MLNRLDKVDGPIFRRCIYGGEGGYIWDDINWVNWGRAGVYIQGKAYIIYLGRINSILLYM